MTEIDRIVAKVFKMCTDGDVVREVANAMLKVVDRK